MREEFNFETICNMIEDNFQIIEDFDSLVTMLNNNGIGITDEELFEAACNYPIIDCFLTR